MVVVPGRKPSGDRAGSPGRPSRASQLSSGIRLPLRRRCLGTVTDRAISRNGSGCPGSRRYCVLGDVGVRFGGSEHHRIETSSSHTRPPPSRAGAPGQRGRACGALRSNARPVPPGVRQAALFGVSRAEPHRAWQKALFGAPDAAPFRDRTPHLLGGAATSFHSGQEPPTSTVAGPPTHLEVGLPALFGAQGVQLRARGLTPGTPRSAGRRASTEPGTSRSSEHGRASSAASGRPHLLGGAAPRSIRSEAQSHRDGIPALQGPGNRRSSELRASCLAGTGQPALFGVPCVQFHRDREPRALRSTGAPVPPGQASRASSEARQARSDGQGLSASPGPGNRRSSGHRAPRLTGPRRPTLFGAAAAAARRTRAPRALRSNGDPGPPRQGLPISQASWTPRPSGQGRPANRG
jgi:hypothetical protein